MNLATRALAMSFFLWFGGLCGCDRYSGTVLALSMVCPQEVCQPATPLPPTAHLELWANVNRDGVPLYLRLPAQVGSGDPAAFSGFSVVPAVDPNDPCLIRGLDRDDQVCANAEAKTPEVCGTQLFSKPAQIVPDGSTADLAQLGLILQARKVTAQTTPFSAVDPSIKGGAPVPLLALVQYNPDLLNDPRLTLPPTDASNAGDAALAEQRLNRCLSYRDGPPGQKELGNANFYVGNPRQYTKPLSGTLFGFFFFQTCQSPMLPTCPVASADIPPQSFSGIRMSIPFALDTIQELLITLEFAQNPPAPTMQRRLFRGVPQPASQSGRGVIALVILVNTNPLLDPPDFSTVVGSAGVLTHLDSRLD